MLHPQTQQRQLWRREEKVEDDEVEVHIMGYSYDYTNLDRSIDDLRQRCSSVPHPKSFRSICQGTLVVGQEFVLVAYFLARHQQMFLEDKDFLKRDVDDIIQVISHLFVLMALLLVLLFNNRNEDSNNNNLQSTKCRNQQPRRIKVKQRSIDALLLALLLRLLAAVLRTLTESYSSDTVHALANAGLILHLLTCDYAYANGCPENLATATTTNTTASNLQKRPAFLGGTVSLNAAFFSTTLLASRLASNSRVYVFVSLSVVLFAFYPAARHGVSKHLYGAIVHLLVLAALFAATIALLPLHTEAYVLAGVPVTVCVVAPLWKYYLQRHKRVISGPWDVAQIKNSAEAEVINFQSNDDSENKDE